MLSLRITGKARVAGVFGDPVEHSLSPVMHNRAFAALGLEWVYVPFHVRAAVLADALQGVRALGLVGVNLTIPHKIAALDLVDGLSVEARLIGAVNTVHCVEGRLTGYNTDGRGFVRSLAEEAGETPRGQRVVIVGAGGAAKAVAVQLALDGAAQITVLNRTPERGAALAQHLREHTGVHAVAHAYDDPQAGQAIAGATLVINATDRGMWPHTEELPPVDVTALSPHALVCDLIYNPLETRFLRAARRRGCRVLPGLGMLLYQGALAFEIWTGQPAPVAEMRAALNEALADRR